MSSLEEVSESILPLKGSINAVWQSNPVLDWFGIPVRDGRIALAVESPIFST